MLKFRNIFKILIIALVIFIYCKDIYAQHEGELYFSGNINQEYSNNWLRLPDSTSSKDGRLLSSIIIGYNLNNILQRWGFDLSYENRYLHYYNLNNYRRMEHYFSINGSINLDTNNILFLYNSFSIRNYDKLKQDNYIRNIVDFYDRINFTHQLHFLIGYKNWIKNYPNSSLLESYLSHRLFTKINYYFNNTDYAGVKLEYQFHRGNLYPGSSLINSTGGLTGSRYYAEIFINKLWGKNLLTEFAYKFESDQPNDNSWNQNQNNFQGDENFEDLLIDDADFDYLKNQFNIMLLVKITEKLSLFSFNVFQFKNFNSWVINTNEDLRRDILFYNSLMMKYKFRSSLSLNLSFNLENNISNLNQAKYNSYKITSGIHFEF